MPSNRWTRDKVCDLFRKHIRSQGLSNKEAAERYGVHRDTLSRVINGAAGPNDEMLNAIGFDREVERITRVVYKPRATE